MCYHLASFRKPGFARLSLHLVLYENNSSCTLTCCICGYLKASVGLDICSYDIENVGDPSLILEEIISLTNINQLYTLHTIKLLVKLPLHPAVLLQKDCAQLHNC